jgi:hypothetical protein
VDVPFPLGGLLLVGGEVDGASDAACAEMSVAKVRKMLMSSRRIVNDMLAKDDCGNDNDNEGNERDSRTGISEHGPSNV